MAEYELVCDACGAALAPTEGVVAWREDDQAKRESGFTLTHVACVPAAANKRLESRVLTWPNGYLAFFGHRLGHVADGWKLDDAQALHDLLHAFAPFVLRPDTGAEMDALRAMSFGAVPGVPFGKSGAPKEIEGGK